MPTTPLNQTQLYTAIITRLDDISTRLSSIELQTAVRLEQIDAKANAAHGRIDKLEGALQTLNRELEELQKLVPAIRMAIWVVGVVSTVLIPAILVWFWQLLTHTATVP